MSPSSGEALGGPAEEARRLVEALGDWASTRLDAADEHLATGSAECQVCPLCQIIAALRGDRSETLSRLNDAWAAFLGVLTAHPHSPDPGSAPEADSETTASPAHRPVQRIDIGE